MNISMNEMFVAMVLFVSPSISYSQHLAVDFEKAVEMIPCRPRKLLSNVVDENLFASMEEPLRGLFLIFSSAQPPKHVPSTMFRACPELVEGAGSELAKWARFIGIAGGETAVIGFACTSGFGGGGKSSNEAADPMDSCSPIGVEDKFRRNDELPGCGYMYASWKLVLRQETEQNPGKHNWRKNFRQIFLIFYLTSNR